jgi:hypothetical protein
VTETKKKDATAILRNRKMRKKDKAAGLVRLELKIPAALKADIIAMVKELIKKYESRKLPLT